MGYLREARIDTRLDSYGEGGLGTWSTRRSTGPLRLAVTEYGGENTSLLCSTSSQNVLPMPKIYTPHHTPHNKTPQRGQET